MIVRSPDFDLGLDQKFIKDALDGQRQTATVDAILTRFFADVPCLRREVQILADEVGMGKTFVSLGVAYSVLAHSKRGDSNQTLSGCYNKVLVLSPQNSSLYQKWCREVGEFVKRCVHPKAKKNAVRFKSIRVERLDDLVSNAIDPAKNGAVIVASMSIFAGAKLKHYDLKRRVLLGLVFRRWSNRFRHDDREKLLGSCRGDWGLRTDDLLALTPQEENQLSLKLEHMEQGLDRAAQGEACLHRLEELFTVCKEIVAPYNRNRLEQFKAVERKLTSVYRHICTALLRKTFPLVIVDEAHNWKGHRSGYEDFCDIIAPVTRRLLMLTATPFQLRPEEVLNILEVSDHLAPDRDNNIGKERIDRLRILREETIRPVLQNSSRASRRFQQAWARLPEGSSPDEMLGVWQSPPLVAVRRQLDDLAKGTGALRDDHVRIDVERAVATVDPRLRQLFSEALFLHAYNTDLSSELGQLVVRHRRQTGHRLFRVGSELAQDQGRIELRPDSHLLHDAPGLDVLGEGELPHYLLMRCISEMKWADNKNGRSSLGTALTGCYSTLLRSSEGKQIASRLGKTPLGALYLNLLMKMVQESHDPKHPKMQAVVDAVLHYWNQGEKVLLFCFRVNTARRLREIINDRIRQELEKRKKSCLGGENELRTLRGRMTGRERDLIGLGLDRVLWSAWKAAEYFGDDAAPYHPNELSLMDVELNDLARLALSYGVDLTDEAHRDRVFLHRAVEHLLAKRFLKEKEITDSWRRLLEQLSDISWVTHPYRISESSTAEDEGEDVGSYDERGPHTVYAHGKTPSSSEVDEVAQRLKAMRENVHQQNRTSVLDFYGQSASLWLGVNPIDPSDAQQVVIKEMHRSLWTLTASEDGFRWETRLQVMKALRQALLRESVLLRLLPTKAEREESQWGELLAESLYRPLSGQHESMAARLTVFLEDLCASGADQRASLLAATRLRDQQFVAFVDGSTKAETRERVFAGFNTPLLPEVLVCTSVGSEGIDLHRHCRHVIHYDMAWNPAVIEQRTGRTDRIGSKTFRERASGNPIYLEIAVPFLAGTYDERMYKELRLRAQTFEVLTGGDFAAENAEGDEQHEGSESSAPTIPVLPEAMVRDLRVRLHVWEAPTFNAIE